MIKHRPLLLTILILLCLCLLSCNTEPPQRTQDTDSSVGSFSFRGRRFSYQGEEGAFVYTEDVLTICRGGVYVLSGRLDEGRIRICADSTVTFLLDGAELHSSYGAVISVEDGGDLVIEAKEGTVNLITCNKYSADSSISPAACISSSGRIRFCGVGRTVVDTDADCGVAALGRVTVDGAELFVNAQKYGVFARDRFVFLSGKLTVYHADVGIFADAREGSEGTVEIRGGTLTAVCNDTALWAGRSVLISGGKADIDAPVIYRCETVSGDTVKSGEIKVTCDGYPEPNQDFKPKTNKNP